MMGLREGTSNRMADNIFTPMELDAIGEVMNISLGSSATAVSNLLDHRVEITTPRVTVCDVSEFTIGDLQPAVGVEIRYVSGLEGSNIMLLKRSDVKIIVDILMGSETPDDEFELNDLTISAVCEVMNQMMGASSTALSDFLGHPVNISTPESFGLDDFENFKAEHFPAAGSQCVVVRFQLNIEGTLQSEFINVMSVELTRELLAGLGLGEDEDAAPQEKETSGSASLTQEEIERLMSGAQSAPEPAPAPQQSEPAPSGAAMTQEEIERLMSGAQSAPEPAPAPQQSAPDPSGGMMTQEEIERMMSGMQSAPEPAPAAAPLPQQTAPAPQQQAAPGGAYPPPYGVPPYAPGYYPPPGYYPAPAAQPAPKMIPSTPPDIPRFANGEPLEEQQAENLDLLMSVPLEVSVEIGRARRKVQDVLAFTKGSLVMLNKLAGDQVDLYVNGQCIAKGDVVVVDDNFGIRITEVLKSPDPNELVRS